MMNFDGFWDVFKWAIPPLVGGLIWVIFRLDSIRKEQMAEQEARNSEEHLAARTKIDEVKQELGQYRERIAGIMATRSDVKELETRMGQRFDRIENKLDTAEATRRANARTHN